MEKIKVLITFIFLLLCIQLFASDIYSKENELKFIDFLFSIKDYDRALNEALRSIQNYEKDKSAFFPYVVKGYLKLKKYESAISFIKKFKLEYNDTLFYSYFKLKKYNQIVEMNEKNDFQMKIKFASYLIKGDLQKTKLLFPKISSENDNLSILLKKNYVKLSEFKEKSPLIAGIMSAILPGSGKIYAGRVADGFFAMLYIISMIYKTYYTYEKHGLNYFETYLWGSLSLYFYIGDIYGSIAAVKFRKRDFLRRMENEIQLTFTVDF